MRATATVPDVYNYDPDEDLSSIAIPAAVMIQFPSVVTPEEVDVLDPSDASIGYLVITVERITDYAIRSDNLGGDVVLSYVTGDFGFFSWTNPTEVYCP